MRDVGRTREEIVSHEPNVSDLQAFQVLFQHRKRFIEPINHIEMCGVLLLYNNYIFHVVYWYNNQ